MRRSIKEGISFGIVAGIVFAVAQMLAAGMMGELGLMPLRMFASIVLGSHAMTSTDVAITVFIGMLVHFVLAGAFGAFYGIIEERFARDTRSSFGKQAAFGMVYAVLLWFVNYQVIARIMYPWFLAPPQGIQMMIHALCYGLPLAVMYAFYERSEHPAARRLVVR
jgi:hypothetical protein